MPSPTTRRLITAPYACCLCSCFVGSDDVVGRRNTEMYTCRMVVEGKEILGTVKIDNTDTDRQARRWEQRRPWFVAVSTVAVVTEDAAAVFPTRVYYCKCSLTILFLFRTWR